jgi:hypothetical protein
MKRKLWCHWILFIPVCFILLFPFTLHAKSEVIKKMKGLHVPFIANDGQMDEKVSFYAKTLI